MGLVPFRGFEVHNTASEVRTSLVDWKPGKLKTRQAYVDSLHVFLNKNFSGPLAQKQPDLGKIRPDIVIAEEVVIYVQKDLKTASQIKVALATLQNYHHWKGVTLLILVGDVLDSAREKIDDAINHINNDFEFMSHQAIIVFKK